MVSGGTAVAAACQGSLRSINGAGDAVITDVQGTKPPTSATVVDRNLYGAGEARIASRFVWGPDVNGSSTNGYVVLGSTLYASRYGYIEDRDEEFKDLTEIADGWDKFTMVEESHVSLTRNARYGLRNDGVLFRWTSGWKTVASTPGFAGVKAMTLISQTASYDTFLATTKAGVLQTIRIPTTASLKPVVKTVRGSTWQGFETLVADKCGTGTLLTAIDRDTNSAYVYSIGHATGTTTPITNLGKLSATLVDPVYSRYTTDTAPLLAGE
ncbi:hypothetical protein GCM10029976_069360 [Kribbella albertanoniae]